MEASKTNQLSRKISRSYSREGLEVSIAGFELRVVASPFLKGGEPVAKMAVKQCCPFKLPFEVQRATV